MKAAGICAACAVLMLSGALLNWDVQADAAVSEMSEELLKSEVVEIGESHPSEIMGESKDKKSDDKSEDKSDDKSKDKKDASSAGDDKTDMASSSTGTEKAGLTDLATKAHTKAEFALNKIKTAKELRSKARQVLKSKGKPIPEILQKGALDDVHKRVLDAQSKLTAKFGPGSKSDGELEAKAEAKRESKPDPQAAMKANAELAKSNADANEAKVKKDAAEKKASMYKEKFKEERRKEKAARDAAKIKETALSQKAELDKKMQQTENDGKVMELEVKMKEKAKEKMDAQSSEPPESDADFNHRQIAQEAYNKQVMGYVMSWEKTHGGPMAGAKQAEEQAEIKSDLGKFVDHYEQKHANIKSDIAVADTPTRK